MKSIKFKECNKVYAENQPEYITMDVLDDGKYVVSCWEISFIEKIRILFTGKIWLSLLMFGNPLTPSFMTAKKRDLIN